LSRIPSPGTNPTGGNPMAHVAASGTLLIAALLIVSYGPYAPAIAENNTPTKPQISIETKYVEISLTVNLELKNYTELFASCLSEGKAWVNKTNADAAAEWRDNRKAFRGLQWFYDRDYVLRSVVGRYVSVWCAAIVGSTVARIQISTPIRFYGTMWPTNAPISARSLPKPPTMVRP